MKKLLCLLCLCILPGCVVYDTPVAYERNYGCVSFCDEYGCRDVCSTYYYDADGNVVYWDDHFNCWIGPAGYFVGGIWYHGFPHGYYEFHRGYYHPGHYYGRGHYGYHGGGYHGGYHGGRR